MLTDSIILSNMEILRDGCNKVTTLLKHMCGLLFFLYEWCLNQVDEKSVSLRL